MLRLAMERLTLRNSLAMPEGVCGWLGEKFAGGVDRSMLDPRLRFLLAANRTKKPLNERSLKQARHFYNEMFRMMDVALPDTVTLRDHYLHVDGVELLMRSYHPQATQHTAAMPGLLFFHGGGFTIGRVDDYDGVVGWLAEQMDAVVVSVDYRLGPEYPFPTAAEDAVAAWQWFVQHTDTLGLNPERLGVMGDSAGGNLAAVVSQQAAARHLPLPVMQCLIYPTLDLRMQTESINTYAEGYGLTRDLMGWFLDHYLQSEDDAKQLLASPGLAETETLANQPPTLLVTATDPLRDEGLAYAAKLQQAGVDVTHMDFRQLVHGFIGMAGVLPAAKVALQEVSQAVAARI